MGNDEQEKKGGGGEQQQQHHPLRIRVTQQQLLLQYSGRYFNKQVIGYIPRMKRTNERNDEDEDDNDNDEKEKKGGGGE